MEGRLTSKGVDSCLFAMLPPEEMREVLSLPADPKPPCTPPNRLAILAKINPRDNTLTLIRGDLVSVLIPLSAFRPNAIEKPDFERLRLVDHGHTVCFGVYEAAVDYALEQAYGSSWFDLDRAEPK